MQWSLPVANKYLIQADTITCRKGKENTKTWERKKSENKKKNTNLRRQIRALGNEHDDKTSDMKDRREDG